MLHTLEDLSDGHVIATDGEIGKVRNFLFDDRLWAVRYFVVEVGGWFERREALISVSVADRPDWDEKAVRVHLSREQVRHSPDVDSAKPVTRQQEIAMREFYGWPASFGENTLEAPNPPLPTGREYPVHTKEDQHLRSAADVYGYAVWDPEGQIGRLEHFIVNERSWRIGYLDVKAGDWLHCRSMLVPTGWVQSVSWATHRLNLKHAEVEAKKSSGAE